MTSYNKCYQSFYSLYGLDYIYYFKRGKGLYPYVGRLKKTMDQAAVFVVNDSETFLKDSDPSYFNRQIRTLSLRIKLKIQ